MPMQSGNFGRLLEPGLRKVFFDGYKEKPSQYTKIFNILTSKKSIETDHRSAGLSEWQKKDTLGSTEYEDFIDGGNILYRHETYSKGVIVEKEMIDDEQYNIIKKRTQQLGRGARHTLESHTISVLNTAFTANGYDGVPLISDKHPLLGVPGSTTSNYLGELALTEQNLELAIKLSREQVNERGLKIQMLPKVLVVPPALEFKALKIVKSVQSTDPTDNFAKNDINALKGRFEVVVMDWLTDDKAWFVMDPDYNELNFFWRERLNFKGDHTDYDTDAVKFKGRMRFSYGYSDFRGWIGSKGA